MPSPIETLNEFLVLIRTPTYYQDIYYTIIQTSLAFILSAIIGILFGLLLSSSRYIMKIFEPVVEFFRAIPSTSIFPLFLLIFGIGIQSRVATAIFVSIWVIIINTIYGIKSTNKARIKSIKVMGGGKIETYIHVSFFEALPFILSALRLTISLSLIIIIVTEMLISPKYGIGVRIFELQQYYKIPSLYVYLFTIGFIGYVVNKLFVKAEHKIVHWSKR